MQTKVSEILKFIRPVDPKHCSYPNFLTNTREAGTSEELCLLTRTTVQQLQRLRYKNTRRRTIRRRRGWRGRGGPGARWPGSRPMRFPWRSWRRGRAWTERCLGPKRWRTTGWRLREEERDEESRMVGFLWNKTAFEWWCFGGHQVLTIVLLHGSRRRDEHWLRGETRLLLPLHVLPGDDVHLRQLSEGRRSSLTLNNGGFSSGGREHTHWVWWNVQPSHEDESL